MIKSEKLYSPREYLEAVTGFYYLVKGNDDVAFIQNALKENNLEEFWDYPMGEINHIAENDIDVVLVDCTVYSEKTKEYKHVYRWFEVPGDFKDGIEEDSEGDKENEEDSVNMTFEEFVAKLANSNDSFEDIYTGLGLDIVECIGNMVYDDQDLYDFLETLGAEISDYGVGYAVIETNNGKIYEVPYENRENRFDPEYPEETILFFDGCRVYDVTE